MPVPQEVARLVEQFERNRDSYRSGAYNETEVRREFLDPFFEALGWDVTNRQGYAERYKDVVHEDAIRVGGAPGAPDYCFRIGGERKFFVEAKKPSVNLLQDTSPAFQLRRYAWSAKLPLSILTDFEEFAVYDCRTRPAKTDRASATRLMYLPYTEYVSRWDEIAGIFSREAVLKGAFDRFAEAREGKRGTAEVDSAFLAEIEGWREALARNLALRNPSLSQRALNTAVQATIDRIIFLRICEDRGIEPYGQLQALQNGARVYPRLVDLFRRADDRYNSGLFHFQAERGRPEPPDDLTPNLTLDDKPLKEILATLYYPDSPYVFSEIPADILGQVYERFLGRVIRLTAGHQAKVEEKPEVRKAGGVYYTPTYIVAYIVRHTVGKLLEGKRPEEVAGGEAPVPGRRRAARARPEQPAAPPLRILDPACGSGSFLIGAYQYLLDWYRDRYAEDDPRKWAGGASPRLYQAAGGEWRLTTTERKRILLAHLYGVDIDTQAVEVTKLSLLLKVLEGESGESVSNQLRLFQERALPDLSANIKCGNSLIGPDFYDGRQLTMLDDEERYRINVFDWQAEFPHVFACENPGFDAVIGNPPYVRMELFKDLKGYLRTCYKAHDERTDLYVYFLERSLGLLLVGGVLGMIVSNKWIRSAYGKRLRQLLVQVAELCRIVDFGELPVFEGAATMPAVLTARRREPSTDVYSFPYTPPFGKDTFTHVVSGTTALDTAVDAGAILIRSDSLSPQGWTLGAGDVEGIVRKLHARSEPLLAFAEGKIRYGIKTGLVDAFVIGGDTRDRLVQQSPHARFLIKPYLVGDDVRNYHIRGANRYLIYTHHGVDMQGCDSILEHLAPFKPRLQKRATRQQWYELQQPQYRYTPDYERPKIVYPDIAKESRFALDLAGRFPADTAFIIASADPYLLGVLNSRAAFFFLKLVCPVLGDPSRGGRLRLKLAYIGQLPIRTINFDDPADRERHDRMVALVQRMLDLHRQLPAAPTAHEKAVVQREIDATDRQIDRLVYNLYELTEEEIRIVDAATGM
ncbi:MAG: Eco57I restriction-modification methylase domain-containing protein [Armatimonadetes bacterium]|nr:Eco57I restriction-modification methylase domain-containing protein [Armatimonadota bacterium]